MADWEEELEQIEEINKANQELENKANVANLYNDEREDILVEKREKTEPKELLPKEDDYEYKWQQRNKAMLERKNEEKIAMQFLSESDRAKKQQELTELNDIKDLFMGVEIKAKKEGDEEEEEKKLFIKTEKEFIDFGVKVSAKLNMKEEYVDHSAKGKKGKTVTKQRNIYNTKFILEFLKKSIDGLMPHLTSTQLIELNKNLTALCNKTLEEERKTGKKPENKKKPAVNIQKGTTSTKGYGGDKYYNDDCDEEFYEEDYNY